MIRFCGPPQGIVTLLLLVAIIPEQSEGQFCYECVPKVGDKSAKCNYLQLGRDDKLIKDCSESETYCHLSGKTEYQTRGCYSKIQGDCIKKFVSGSCYDSANNNAPEIAEKVKACTEDAGLQLTPLPETGEVCICSGQLSNQGALGNPEVSPCPKELNGLGPVEGSGIMCYKCEGPQESDCGKRPDLDKIEKANCPDWKFGRQVWKAACFKSRSGGKESTYVRGCGFQIQAHCRIKHFTHTCLLSRAEVFEYKDKAELNTKQGGVKDCEAEARGNLDKIDLRIWYNKQAKNNHSAYGRVVGHLGALQDDIGRGDLHKNYRDCVCLGPLCNPAGRITSHWGVIMAFVFVVLNGELFSASPS